MLIVNVKEHGNIERALKALKSKVIKTRQVKQLQDRKEFVKYSVKKRTEILNAVYRQQKQTD